MMEATEEKHPSERVQTRAFPSRVLFFKTRNKLIVISVLTFHLTNLLSTLKYARHVLKMMPVDEILREMITSCKIYRLEILSKYVV